MMDRFGVDQDTFEAVMRSEFELMRKKFEARIKELEESLRKTKTDMIR